MQNVSKQKPRNGAYKLDRYPDRYAQKLTDIFSKDNKNLQIVDFLFSLFCAIPEFIPEKQATNQRNLLMREGYGRVSSSQFSTFCN